MSARAATTVATQRSDFNANLESSQRRHSNEKRTPTLPDARLEEEAGVALKCWDRLVLALPSIGVFTFHRGLPFWQNTASSVPPFIFQVGLSLQVQPLFLTFAVFCISHIPVSASPRALLLRLSRLYCKTRVIENIAIAPAQYD